MSGAGSPLSSHQHVEYDDSEPSQAYELFVISHLLQNQHYLVRLAAICLRRQTHSSLLCLMQNSHVNAQYTMKCMHKLLVSAD